MKRYLGKRKELKIYISNEDSFDGKPLFEVLLNMAKESGLAGATVYKAVAGLGAHSHINTFSVWVLKQKVPLVIDIIDEEKKIVEFLKKSENIIQEGLVTMNDIEVIKYYHPKFEEK